MIERLVGTVIRRHGHTALIDVNGVGYGAEMPERALLALAGGESSTTQMGGEKIEVWVHTHVREDALKLYGFITFEERELFSLLLSVSGVGPKIALAVINEFAVNSLVEAVLTEDHKALESVPGIGPRQSKKLLLELKPKMEKLKWAMLAEQPSQSSKRSDLFAGATAKVSADNRQLLQDVQSALINLGYKEKEIQKHLRSLTLTEESTVEEILRTMLLRLSGHGGDTQSLENELF